MPVFCATILPASVAANRRLPTFPKVSMPSSPRAANRLASLACCSFVPVGTGLPLEPAADVPASDAERRSCAGGERVGTRRNMLSRFAYVPVRLNDTGPDAGGLPEKVCCEGGADCGTDAKGLFDPIRVDVG